MGILGGTENEREGHEPVGRTLGNIRENQPKHSIKKKRKAIHRKKERTRVQYSRRSIIFEIVFVPEEKE